MLEVFRESIPLYHSYYVARSATAPAGTDAMNLGTALHARILEPDRYDKIVAVKPARKTKAWLEENKGKCILTQDQAVAVPMMADSIARNPDAVDLLARTTMREEVVYWRHEESGMECKSKLDAFNTDGLVLDIKTSSHPTPRKWARSAFWDYGYHRQLAFYVRAVKQKFNLTHVEFRFIVVGTIFPHECIVYELDHAAAQAGDREITDSLCELSDCIRRNAWSTRWSGVHRLNWR